ncbi:hypothetical protein O3Q52_01440 [Streptomyces sp. ActVer]|uniref:hypothetical protein n=1 Tax=Streptomyces sp. ActVer TaxID=3014558 RepID=UPI0022B3B1D8|nr:hypothetical protein [Streptomyces sp. ActVer]MCZ4506891.1 hypothetical protein [Streptomyces sp. ActVer]
MLRPITRTRGVLLTLALTAIATAITAPPTASAAAERSAQVGAPCTRSQLAVPAGTYRAGVYDADPTGRFQVGYMMDTAFVYHLIRWTDGVPEDLGTTRTGAKGINAHGDIVGSEFDNETYRSAGWLYRNGEFSALPGIEPGFDTIPESINADGTVSGASGAPGQRPVPVLWTPAGDVRPLDLPPGDAGGRGTDIDDDGTIVGWTDAGPETSTHAARWSPDGTPERLPEHRPGPETGSRAEAVAGDTALGYEVHATGPTSILLWRNGTAGGPEVLGEGAPQAVNRHGSVVVLTTPDTKLWLIQNGVTRSLPSDTTPFPTAEVTALTDHDIAYGRWNSTPVRWDCRLP